MKPRGEMDLHQSGEMDLSGEIYLSGGMELQSGEMDTGSGEMDLQSLAPPSAPPLAPPLDQSMLWLLGLGLAFVSTILSTIGLLIQKTSADLEKHKPAWRRWRFWLGFAINLGSEVTLTPVAMSLTPLSLLAPMTGVGIATGTLISASGCLPGLKEPLSCSEAMSTVLVIGGPPTSNPNPNPNPDPNPSL